MRRKAATVPAPSEAEEAEVASAPPKTDPVEAGSEQHPPAKVAEDVIARRPSAEVAREVYARDEGQCTFIAQDGRRCSAREFVEFDHIEPHALGGEATAANLRLRCRAHNQLYARQVYGDEHMATAVARARKRTRREKAA